MESRTPSSLRLATWIADRLLRRAHWDTDPPSLGHRPRAGRRRGPLHSLGERIVWNGRRGFASLVIIALLVRFARAADAEPVTLEYAVPSGCPDSEAFFRQVTARRPAVRRARPGEDGRALHIVVLRDRVAFRGEVSLRDAGGSTRSRVVYGATCPEVVAALGLMGAIALDFRSSGSNALADGDAQSSDQASKVGSFDGAQVPAPASNVGKEGANHDSGPTLPTPYRRSIAESSSPTAPRRRPTHLSAGAEVALYALGAPLIGGGLFGDLEVDAGRRPWVPSLRMSVARTLDATIRASAGGARIHLTQATLEACPLSVDLAPAFGLHPCAGAVGGVLHVSGVGVSQARSHAGAWAALIASLRLTWSPSLVSAEIQAGATVPLVRDSFVFDPGVFVYRAPPLGAVIRCDVGVRFW